MGRRKRILIRSSVAASLTLSLWATAYWRPETAVVVPGLTELGPSPNLRAGIYGLNNAGQMCGVAAGRERSCIVWDQRRRPKKITRVVEMTAGRSINNRGAILGTSLVEGKEVPSVWSPREGTRVLDGLPEKCVALHHNDREDVVGYYCTQAGGLRGFRWSPGDGFVDLSEETGVRFIFANSINNRGRIAGQIYRDGVLHAAVWDRTDGLVDLHPADAESSCAVGVNDRGQVVGYFKTRSQCAAFLWSRERGLLDLNRLLPASSDWRLMQATGINDRNEIVGMARMADDFRGFILKL